MSSMGVKRQRILILPLWGVGVLTEAKESGHIDAVRPYLEALREKAGFWISDALYRRVLRDVKEHPK
jgi:predicted nucleic acid-binding protein